MDPVSLILTALVAGAAASAQATAGDAVKDAYTGLKALLQHKFAGKPRAEAALAGYEDDPEAHEKPLKKVLVQEGIAQDPEVVGAAQKVMQLLQFQRATIGKYNIRIAGNVYGYAQGDNQTVNMTFGKESKEE